MNDYLFINSLVKKIENVSTGYTNITDINIQCLTFIEMIMF